ncbi:MAG: galactofuranose ABC transporter, permease protein YjfF [Tepidisphaeraceae bacterium]
MSEALSYATPALGRRRSWLPSPQKLPLLATFIVFIVMYSAACMRYHNFSSIRVACNLLSDNSFLGMAAIGETFVIIAGGIDLSVGTAIGCTSVFIAEMVTNHGWNPMLAVLVTLAGGTLVGLIHGWLIATFELQPFLVTLGGLFFYHGLGLLISTQSISITHPMYADWSTAAIHLGNGDLRLSAILFLLLLIASAAFAAFRPMGRAIYAVGGNEQSALLMGLPVNRIKIGVYAFSGFCAALAGVTATIMMSSGTANTGQGLELDAIAAAVIGGTLLSGGVGTPIGTLLGVLIAGVIQTAITFEGTLNSWWSRIVIGLLLLAFILLQTLLQPRETHA